MFFTNFLLCFPFFYFFLFVYVLSFFLSMYLCTFTLAVSGGAVLLLPFSIISNEILLSLPKNYYIQWLNGSLIHGQYHSFFHFTSMPT